MAEEKEEVQQKSGGQWRLRVREETFLHKVAPYLSEGAWTGIVNCTQVKYTIPAARSPASQCLPELSFHPSSSFTM